VILHALLIWLAYACLTIGATYSLLSLVAVLVWRTQTVRLAPSSAQRPPVTILKPLCGDEPHLYAHLRSFCTQEYPQYQIVFGVHDATDPALAVVSRLIDEFPSASIDVVVNSRQHGDNLKNSNLMNMLEVARHDVLIVADSDAQVGADYLGIVTAPLLKSDVGLVTCIYRSVPTSSVWSRLGAMYINEWFMPSVLVAWLFGHQSYASGQTLCLRRETLSAIGGLRNITSHLADDYRLGELVRGVGLKIELSRYEIDAGHHEPTLRALMRHQLRWMRTLRVLRPASFCFIFLTFSLPLTLVGLLLLAIIAGIGPMAWQLAGSTVFAQLLLHLAYRVRGDRGMLADLALVPARDLLLCLVWWQSFFTSHVTWRGSEFNVDAQGIMRRAA
jgi:ceramide glucosyltransferase